MIWIARIVCVLVHVRERVRQNTVQYTIDGGEKRRERGIFKGDEVRKMRGELKNRKLSLHRRRLDQYDMKVKAREHGLYLSSCGQRNLRQAEKVIG
jgi:hypothetical protein